MSEPPSPTVGLTPTIPDHATVVAADEQSDVTIDLDRWRRLAVAALEAEGAFGELTLTFIDRDEIASLNVQHLGGNGPTDVLSFPLDADAAATGGVLIGDVLLGDVVICPAVAAEQAADHAGTLDDELALLVIHGILHVLGHDHAEPDETATMRAREVELLERFHRNGPPPSGFRQEQS